jgi:hypothetical protein
MFQNLKNSAANAVTMTSDKKKAIASLTLIIASNVAIIVAGHYIGEYIEKNI